MLNINFRFGPDGVLGAGRLQLLHAAAERAG